MPGGPTFSDRPNYRRRRLVVLVLGAAVIALVVVLLTRGGPVGDRPIPTLAFTAKVTNVAQGNAPDAGAAQGEGDALITMFNDFYQEAFVDPGKWGDGTFTDLIERFAKDAQAQATKDLASLTIGEARTELKRVDLGPSTLDVTVYYNGEAKPLYAVAVASFSGRGTLKRSGPPLNISQRATYYLTKSGDAWTITAYDASQDQATPTPSPTASPTGRRT